MSSNTDWVAVDWGTSNVRAWGISPTGDETFATQSDRGMGKIKPDDYPEVLAALIGDHAPSRTAVVVCGMAGARQGWLEAPYIETPADLTTLAGGAVIPPGSDFDVRILPGICQPDPGREDVMRGEETQLLGLLALRPGFEGTVVLPGTHSKWVEIKDGRVVRFATAMTGEMYEILSQHSVLRHSFTGDQADGEDIEAGITEGMQAGLDDPALLTSLAFRTRAAALLSGKSPGWCSGYLSGLLVGAEIGGHGDWLTDQPVPLIGSARFGTLYGTALAMLGLSGEPMDASQATMAGLKQARAQ